jgi:type IV secretion system protein VirB10
MKPACYALILAACAFCQSQPAATTAQPDANSAPIANAAINVPRGTRLPLVLINTVTTKDSVPGDSIYLETTFPVVVNGKIVIPPGSSIIGSVTQVKRPGRIKGRGELYVRFDQLILPNGVTRDFRATVSSQEGGSRNVDKTEGKIKAEKGTDLEDVAISTTTGAGVGAVLGGIAGRTASGAGIGAAIGAATILPAVLIGRGPDASLSRGTVLEVELNRPLGFDEHELDFSKTNIQRTAIAPASNQQQPTTRQGGWGRPWPF